MGPGPISWTSTVPATVPSVTNSSRPVSGIVAEKYSRPAPAGVSPCGWLGAPPDAKARAKVFCNVPSVRQSTPDGCPAKQGGGGGA